MRKRQRTRSRSSGSLAGPVFLPALRATPFHDFLPIGVDAARESPTVSRADQGVIGFRSGRLLSAVGARLAPIRRQRCRRGARFIGSLCQGSYVSHGCWLKVEPVPSPPVGVRSDHLTDVSVRSLGRRLSRKPDRQDENNTSRNGLLPPYRHGVFRRSAVSVSRTPRAIGTFRLRRCCRTPNEA